MTCFLCLSQSTSYGRHLSQNRIIPLRNIFRFLNFQDVTMVELEQTLRSKTEIISVCGNCSVILDQFNDIFIIYEETRLRLIALLEPLVKVIESVHVESKSVKPSSRVGTLRAQLAKSGKTRIQMQTPRLELTRVAVLVPDDDDTSKPPYLFKPSQENLSNSDLDAPEPSPASAPSPEPPCDSDAFDPNYEDVKINCVSPNDTDSDSDSGAVYLKPTHSKRKEMPRIRYIPCIHCKLLIESSHMRGHEMRNHCEQYFRHAMMPTFTPSRFKTLVDKFLFPTFVRNKKCTLCKKCLKTTNPKTFGPGCRRHFLRCHFSELSSKLKEMQGDEKLLAKIFEPKGKNHPFKCDRCDTGFGTKYGLEYHKRTCGTGTANFLTCHQCGGSFNPDPSNFRRHLKTCGKKKTPGLPDARCVKCRNVVNLAGILQHKDVCSGDELEFEGDAVMSTVQRVLDGEIVLAEKLPGRKRRAISEWNSGKRSGSASGGEDGMDVEENSSGGGWLRSDILMRNEDPESEPDPLDGLD